VRAVRARVFPRRQANRPARARRPRPGALPILGGTLPLHVFTDVLGIPCLWIPAANSNNQQHDINEHYVLRHFYRQTVLYAAIVSSRPM